MTLVRPPEFTASALVEDDRALVEVTGELDLSTAPALSESLAPLIDAHPRQVTLDLAGLEFIDSTGLTLIVRTSNALAVHEGRLVLAHATPAVRRVLEIVGLDGLLAA